VTAAHASRRRRLAEEMARHGRGLAIVPTAPERLRSRDSEHPYRHDSNFHHLTGFDEPEAWLLIDERGHSVLLCREKNAEREIWDGRRLGPESAVGTLGVDEAFPMEALDKVLVERLTHRDTVWLPFDRDGLQGQVQGWLAEVRQRDRTGAPAPSMLRDIGPLLAEMRLIKDDSELATMRRAAQISAGAHARAMRFCAEHFREPAAEALPEYRIEAELLHEFRRHGAQSPAYISIVAAGANACVLHHCAGASLLQRDSLCLIDAGCELDGYASDVTRTFPASGRFSAAQRELYDIVLAAQDAAVACTRPGARRIDAHDAAVRVLSQGMLDTGLLQRDKVGSVDDVIASAAYRQFYMHGTGHWLGRDVHDVGEYLALDEPPVEQPDGHGGRVIKHPSRKLQPGMVLTIEPGLYVRPAEGVPERYWNIGIRIEDDAIVNAQGCELISRGVPVAAAEIEALMRG
jgi:Xaa-Pro aminopeptidase